MTNSSKYPKLNKNEIEWKNLKLWVLQRQIFPTNKNQSINLHSKSITGLGHWLTMSLKGELKKA